MEPMSRFIDQLKSTTVIITVGEGEGAKEYHLPEGVLRTASPWFEKALKDGRFEEGRTARITLPEDSPAVFGVFVYYGYHGTIVFQTEEPYDLDTISKELILLFKVWSFGDKYFLPVLQNCAMLRICFHFEEDLRKRDLEADTLVACWHASNQGSPLRLVIADLIVEKVKHVEGFDMPHCPGLIHELDASYRALYLSGDNAKDFPRFRKPTKFSSLLYVQGTKRRGVGYDDQWENPNQQCDECGFTVETFPICSNCRASECGCETDWDGRIIRVCGDCM